MSKTNDDTTNANGSEHIAARFPRRLRERIERRIESESTPVENKSDLLREAVRQYCLREETRERAIRETEGSA